MSQREYIKVYSGYHGLPMMVAHAPDLGGDIPTVFAALTDGRNYAVTESYAERFRAELTLPSPLFNLLALPRIMMIIPESLNVDADLQHLTEHIHGPVQLQRTPHEINGRFEEGMRRAVTEFVKMVRTRALK